MCCFLYRHDVRNEVERLRNADDRILKNLNRILFAEGLNGFKTNKHNFDFITEDVLISGYFLLLERFGIPREEMPIINKTDRKIVFHSMNFCPTLEACKILELDTRYICKKMNEVSTDTLIKQIDGRLQFTRNYDKLRPNTEYCEEMISITEII